MQNLKTEITQGLVKLLPDQERITVEEASVSWYHNIREQGGLRLTAEGFRVLSQVLGLNHWRFVISTPKSVNKKTLLEMDRKIKFPYYIEKRNRGVIFFSSREAMMVTMYGDLTKWLENQS